MLEDAVLKQQEHRSDISAIHDNSFFSAQAETKISTSKYSDASVPLNDQEVSKIQLITIS